MVSLATNHPPLSSRELTQSGQHPGWGWILAWLRLNLFLHLPARLLGEWQENPQTMARLRPSFLNPGWIYSRKSKTGLFVVVVCALFFRLLPCRQPVLPAFEVGLGVIRWRVAGAVAGSRRAQSENAKQVSVVQHRSRQPCPWFFWRRLLKILLTLTVSRAAREERNIRGGFIKKGNYNKGQILVWEQPRSVKICKAAETESESLALWHSPGFISDIDEAQHAADTVTKCAGMPAMLGFSATGKRRPPPPSVFPRKGLWQPDTLSQAKEGERGNGPLNNRTSADK